MKVCFYNIYLVGLTALMLFSGCIKEDYAECKQSLLVSFYSKAPCWSESIDAMDLTDMQLFVFDESDLLVTSLSRKSLSFDKDYVETVDLPGGGYYSVIAWAGLNAGYYDISKLSQGITKKSDLLLKLRRVQEQAHSLYDTQLYFGESPEVYVEESSSESTYGEAAVNLLEVTNRIHISIEGLSGSKEEYEVYVESDNGAMNMNGTLAADDVLRHESVDLTEGRVLKKEFSLLKLDPSRTNTLVVRDITGGKEIFRGNLLTALIQRAPDVNLNCDHDFNIDVIVGDGGTYASVEIWVNGWLVHSYDTEM